MVVERTEESVLVFDGCVSIEWCCKENIHKIFW